MRRMDEEKNFITGDHWIKGGADESTDFFEIVYFAPEWVSQIWIFPLQINKP